MSELNIFKSRVVTDEDDVSSIYETASRFINNEFGLIIPTSKRLDIIEELTTEVLERVGEGNVQHYEVFENAIDKLTNYIQKHERDNNVRLDLHKVETNIGTDTRLDYQFESRNVEEDSEEPFFSYKQGEEIQPEFTELDTPPINDIIDLEKLINETPLTENQDLIDGLIDNIERNSETNIEDLINDLSESLNDADSGLRTDVEDIIDDIEQTIEDGIKEVERDINNINNNIIIIINDF